MNRTTKLPSRVQHKAAHPNLGDVTIATAFENYQDVNGLKLPSKYVTTIDEYPQLTIDVTANHINVDAPNLAAPDTVKAAAAPAPAVPVVEVEPVGTGIWWLAGSGNHRSIVFTRMCHETGCWCKPTSMTAPGDATFGAKRGTEIGGQPPNSCRNSEAVPRSPVPRSPIARLESPHGLRIRKGRRWI